MFVTTIRHLESLNSSSRKRTCEIVIVNDGSTDRTTQTALELAKKYKAFDIRVVTLEKNVGKGGAVRHGMLHGRGRRLLMVDADGASRFEDLELLWVEVDKLEEGNEAAIAIGSRAHLVNTDVVVKVSLSPSNARSNKIVTTKYIFQRSFVRNLAMYALHTVLRLVGVGHIRDTQCGFKLFSRKAAQDIFPSQRLSGWIFDVELLLMAKLLNIPVAEVPISWNEVPESKIRLLRDSVMMFKDLLVMRVNYALGRWTVDGEKMKRE